jgi:hypothetical protein
MGQAMKIAITQDSGVDLAGRRDAWTQTRAWSTDSTVHFRRVSGRAGLLSIERVWRRISAQWPAAAHYQTYDWYRIYLDVLESHENDWHFFVVYQGYTPVGIVPLRQTKITLHGVPLRALELPDHPHVPFADLIVPDLLTAAFAAAFVAYLRNSGLAWDALVLRRISADSPTLRLFVSGAALACAVASHRYLHTTARANGADRDWHAYQQLAKLGHTEYIASRDKATLYDLFKTFLQVEASGWQVHAGLRGAIRDDSRLVRYYRRLIDAFGDGGCEIGIFRLNGQPIAVRFCLLADDIRYVLKIGYDAAYVHLAPWHHVDPQSRATFDIHRFNTTWSGLLAYACMQAGKILQPAYRDYRHLRAVARGRVCAGIAQVSRAMDQYLRCP